MNNELHRKSLSGISNKQFKMLCEGKSLKMQIRYWKALKLGLN